MGKIVIQEETTPAIPSAGNATLFVDSADEKLSMRLSSGTVVKFNDFNDAMVFRGVIDCSTNPNYPAADAGDVYKISVAGKIGGASGTNVEANDVIICTVDGSPSGTQAAVGANWTIIQSNLDGAVIGPASSTNNAIAVYDGTTGKLLKDSILTVSGSTITGSITGNAATVTTNANLTGAVTSVGNATSLGSFSSANLAGALTDETGTGLAVFSTSPTLVTPALGTPSALVGTNITGTASGLTAGTVTTNANLTGAVTSVGNATSLGSFTSAQLAGALTDETGTGASVFAASPTLSGTPLSTTAAVDTDTPQIATTAFVLGQAAAATPLVESGAGAVGTSTRYARADHVHPASASTPSGAQVALVVATYSANTALTTIIPLDDTIPQNTEGTEIVTATITPTSATNRLLIRFSGFGSSTVNNLNLIAALFQDTTANALNASASTVAGGANNTVGFDLTHTMIAGTTSATTFKIRVGPETAATIRLNGTGAARLFGGAASALLTIAEIKV